MSFRDFAKRTNPRVTTVSSPVVPTKTQPFDISKDLKPGMRIYWKNPVNNSKHYCTFTHYVDKTHYIEVWGLWEREYSVGVTSGWVSAENAYLAEAA